MSSDKWWPSCLGPNVLRHLKFSGHWSLCLKANPGKLHVIHPKVSALFGLCPPITDGFPHTKDYYVHVITSSFLTVGRPGASVFWSPWWIFPGPILLTWTLRWRHNEHDCVSNRQPQHYLLNPFGQTQIKENIKAPRYWPLCGEFTGDRWILRTNGQ